MQHKFTFEEEKFSLSASFSIGNFCYVRGKGNFFISFVNVNGKINFFFVMMRVLWLMPI